MCEIEGNFHFQESVRVLQAHPELNSISIATNFTSIWCVSKEKMIKNVAYKSTQFHYFT